MSCHDDRDERDQDKAARAACEMAKVIEQNSLMSKLTVETRRWVTHHNALDAWRASGYKAPYPIDDPVTTAEENEAEKLRELEGENQ